MARAEDWELTGNHYLALPMIDRDHAALHSVNVLHRGAMGLLEWSAELSVAGAVPLLRPRLRIDGSEVPFHNLTWERLERWLPRFRMTTPGGVRVTATLCAPTGYDASRRGCFYLFEFEYDSSVEAEVEIALLGEWRWALQTIGSRRPVVAERRLTRSSTRDGLALEVAGAVQAALGIAVFGANSFHRASLNGAEFTELTAGSPIQAPQGAPIRFELGRTVRVSAKRRVAVAFFLGLGAEREGALATAGALRRLGAERLLKETRLDLSRFSRKVREPAFGAILNRNLLFCYFYSAARALDDERIYPLTSRSPLHPRCATFNERDTLLWAFPALLIADPPIARELLLRCFEQHSHRPGEALRYIDGNVLEPGLALDQWCAYVIAVDRYLTATGDRSILDEPLVNEVMRELDAALYPRLHPEVFLAATELAPSGEPSDHAFLAYDNALLHAFCRILASLQAADSADKKRLAAAAEEIGSAVWRKCVVDVGGEPLLAWSTDLAESASVYDDPAGSLQLLPHYGFCEATEPLWRNTLDFLRSSKYKLWLGERRFPGLAARSTPKLAGSAALCADLLGTRAAEALTTVRQLSLAGGVGATHYDPDTGAASGALHDAGVSGFLAWSLQLALNA